MATQPAVRQDSQSSETIACISTTTCPDLFATSTAGGLVVLWNISGTLKVVLFFVCFVKNCKNVSFDYFIFFFIFKAGTVV
jgi:uncharacterized integral membrane protein